jgi:hypothetical protein
MKIKINIPKTATTTSSKISIAAKLPKQTKEPKAVIQKFFITHSDKSLIIKFGDSSFGYHDGQIVERNTTAKDSADIRKILNLIKQLRKLNVSYEDIAERLNVANFATSIKSFNNAINKPKETAETN